MSEISCPLQSTTVSCLEFPCVLCTKRNTLSAYANHFFQIQLLTQNPKHQVLSFKKSDLFRNTSHKNEKKLKLVQIALY